MKAGGTQINEILWHRTKGDTDYKTLEGNGTQVETIRDQGRCQTSDTRGRASDLKQEESYFSIQNMKFT